MINLNIFYVFIFSLLGIAVTYAIVERGRKFKFSIFTYIGFPLLVLFSIFLYYPYFELLVWIAWCFFLYAVLDDWLTSSVNICFFIIATMLLVVEEYSGVWLIIATVITLVLVLWAYKNKSDNVGLGDIYALLPLIYFFRTEMIWIMVYSIIVLYLVMFVRRKRDGEVPYLPYLAVTILVYSYNSLILFPLLILYILIYIFALIKKAMKK